MSNTAIAPSEPPTTTRSARVRADDVALIATFAALIAVTGLMPDIKTGLGVPYSLQTFAVLLSGAALGPWRGVGAVLLYLLGGSIGLPIFSGGAAGIGQFAGITGGYLVAFPFAAALCGWVVARSPRKATDFTYVFSAGLLSSFVFVHTLGPLGIAWRGDLPIKEAFMSDTVYFPGDIAKNIVMALIATQIHRAFPTLIRR